MVVTKDKGAAEERGKKPKVAVFILLFIAVLFIAFTAYLKSNGLDIGKSKELAKNLFGNIFGFLYEASYKEDGMKLCEISFEAKEKPDFIAFKDMLIKCTIYGITAMDKKGNEQWNVTAKMNSPCLKTKGGCFLAADIGGRQLFVMDAGGLKWEKSFEGDIINAGISQGGFVTVLHEQEKYRGVVKVFSPEGREIFRRLIVDTFILSGEVLPSGETVIIHGVNTSGISAASYMEFTDLTGNPFAALVPRENHVYPFVLTLGDDSFALVNDTSIIYYNKNRNEVWSKEYKKIYGAGIINNKGFIAAVKNSEGARGCKIEMINKSGDITGDYMLGDEVYNISTIQDTAAVNTVREVHFINSKGNLIARYNTLSDIEEVHFFNKGEAAVVTRNSVDIIAIQ